MSFYHDPVMLKETLDCLVLNKAGTYVDCTLGGGGHSEAILKRLLSSGDLISFDRDPAAIAFATERLSPYKNKRIVHGEFSTILDEVGVEAADGILADLGISSRQVDDGERGFSFKNSESIDLRMNPTKGLDATSWLIETPLEEVAVALGRNSDLPKPFRLAKKLKEVASESSEGVLSMEVLLKAVEACYPKKGRDLNSLGARVLQALRMEVNEELKEIESAIEGAVNVLKKGGRFVFLTYHSVEDRLVKQLMKRLEEPERPPKNVPVLPKDLAPPIFKRVIKKFVPPTDDEIARNPRARSAKMRVYERV